ncbi:hypothetical protein RPW65_13665 [Pseudomonas sp. NyZ704]|nr:hypothetical protein RPW65_13665 [Pseudomonas sp. NyZ704]
MLKKPRSCIVLVDTLIAHYENNLGSIANQGAQLMISVVGFGQHCSTSQ